MALLVENLMDFVLEQPVPWELRALVPLAREEHPRLSETTVVELLRAAIRVAKAVLRTCRAGEDNVGKSAFFKGVLQSRM